MLFIASHAEFGAVLVTPAGKRMTRKVKRHMEEMTGQADESAYLQREDEIESLREMLPRRARKQFDDGWDVTFRADAWTVLHFWGYDAHTLAE